MKCFHEAELLTRLSPISDNTEIHVGGVETEAWKVE